MKNVFDIEAYGAKPDGATVNTSAIQRAIDDCCKAGGGRVFCGPGEFITGTFQLKSGVDLHLSQGCRLVGSANHDDYTDLNAPGLRAELAPEKTTLSLVQAVEAEDFSITGPGEINGSGPAFYDKNSVLWERFYCKPDLPRPRMLMAFRCRDFRIEDASFNESPCWTFWLMQCRNVGIHRIRMQADQKMINNDGIDLDMCSNVTVSDCILKTSDDCIVLRAMRDLYEEERACENVVVSNCVLDSWCQGIRVGCPGDGVIRNCTFTNLVITGPCNGIAFINPRSYLPEGNPGSADIRNILFSNVTIDCENMPIVMDVEDGVALPYLGDVSFSNLRIKSGKPITVRGSRKTVIRGVNFDNVDIETTGSMTHECVNCRDVRFNNVNVSSRIT